MKNTYCAGVFLVLLSATLGRAQYQTMDYGPFLSATIVSPLPSNNVSLRGIAVPFDAPIAGEKEEPVAKGKPAGKPGQVAILFDTEMLRYAACWQGGFLNLTGVAFSGAHGANPSPQGKQVLGTRATPGWAKDGNLKDPRAIPHGPLPRDWARYKGLYRHDAGVVFSYNVGDCQVLDMPSVEVAGSSRIFCRTLNLSKSTQPLVMVVADVEGAKGKLLDGGAVLEKQGKATLAHAVGAPPGTTFEIVDDSRIVLKMPALAQATRIKLCLWHGEPTEQPAATVALTKSGEPVDLTPFTRGGKTRWTEPVTTQGVRAPDTAAYVVDQITVPFKNPYNSWMRFGGFDFFSDGRAAVCTWSGDVWIVSGIDDKLDKVTWKRFASGLFQPLGLKIVNDTVHVLGRDGLMRLHDLNGDGEADFYECLNNDFMVTKNFHEFIFDLHTDPDGNFYFIKGGPVPPGGRGWDKIVPHHGCMMKVSKDGSKLEVVARGFRAPNGMCVGPHGEITCGDNEGTWTPMCPLNWITPGGFYGVPDFSDRTPKPAVRDNPLCWLPREIDNSNGGQVWITSPKFGPLSGRLLHTSYGTCSLYNVLFEEVAGQKQGGVAPLLKFDSGICRARFNTEQNALYLTGLRGWQTSAAKDAGFYRVRYTGKKIHVPVGLNVTPGAIRITFNEPLSKKEAEEADNYNVSQWNYRWTQNYGSPKFKVSNPKLQGHDDLEVDAAVLSADGKSVTLKIANLQPVMQMKIAYNLKAIDGAQVKSVIHNTINVVGDLRGELHPGELKVVKTK